MNLGCHKLVAPELLEELKERRKCMAEIVRVIGCGPNCGGLTNAEIISAVAKLKRDYDQLTDMKNDDANPIGKPFPATVEPGEPAGFQDHHAGKDRISELEAQVKMLEWQIRNYATPEDKLHPLAELKLRREAMAAIVRALGNGCCGMAHDEIAPAVAELKRQAEMSREGDEANAADCVQLLRALGIPDRLDINQQEAAMERIRDLIAAEGELGDVKEKFKTAREAFDSARKPR